MRLMAATVMSTASLMALSAHASDCWLCICSAMSCSRFWNSGSLKKPKPSILVSSHVGHRFRGPKGEIRLRILSGPGSHRAPQREVRDDARQDREPEGEAA